MSSTKPLTDRTEAVYRELKSMRRRFQIGSWITMIVGGLLLLLVVVYFSIGYSAVSELKDPELVVSLVGQAVDDQIPIQRQRLEDEVKNNASTWAEQASQQVLAALPQLREQIEQLALQQSDNVIAQIDVVGEQQFRRIIDENRSTMQRAIQDLKNDEDVSEEVLLALQLAIEKELQIDANSQADAVLTIVSDLNTNMGELIEGKDLTLEQKAERRALMLAKRLLVETFGEDIKIDLDDVALPAVADQMVKEREEKRMRKEAEKAAAESDAAPAEKKDAPAEAKPADKPKEADKPAAKPAEKKDAPAKAKPADKPKEADKPAAKPAEKKDAPAKAKPADKPKEADKPAAKPAEKKDAPAKAKPADKPKEPAKPAEKPAAEPKK